jgi:hypothetical protein
LSKEKIAFKDNIDQILEQSFEKESHLSKSEQKSNFNSRVKNEVNNRSYIGQSDDLADSIIQKYGKKV